MSVSILEKLSIQISTDFSIGINTYITTDISINISINITTDIRTYVSVHISPGACIIKLITAVNYGFP